MARTSSQPRQPRGIPQGGQWASDGTAHGTDDLPAPPVEIDPETGKPVGSTLEFDDPSKWSKRDKALLWLEDRLRAREGEYRDDPVMSYEREIELLDKAVGTESEPGPIMRGLLPYFDNRAECRQLALAYADEKLLCMRRSCARNGNTTRTYSERFVCNRKFGLFAPVRVERILAKPPWRLSAHRMRVGMRYKRRVDQWRAKHGGRMPDSRERDRLWDENMRDFVAEKIRNGKSFGHGMTLSDGHSADPSVNQEKTRMWTDPKDGSKHPFNGRKDFETMLDNGMRHLSRTPAFDIIAAQNTGEALVSRVDDADLSEVVEIAARHGIDLNTVAARLDIKPDSLRRMAGDAWEG